MMAYDEKLAARVRKELQSRLAVDEISMFGGLCFTLRGNMLVGILKDELMVRLSKEEPEILNEPHVRPMDFTGKPMRGFFFVQPEGTKSNAALRRWINRCEAYSASLPPKH